MRVKMIVKEKRRDNGKRGDNLHGYCHMAHGEQKREL
jgi:hypothetical protein